MDAGIDLTKTVAELMKDVAKTMKDVPFVEGIAGIVFRIIEIRDVRLLCLAPALPGLAQVMLLGDEM